MKILIQNNGGGAHHFERLGLAKAFQSCGHEVVIWNPEGKSPHDQFDEFTPHLFIGQGFNLSKATLAVLLENPEVNIYLKLGDWGPLADKYDLTKYQILVASQQEKDSVKQLTAANLRVCGGAHYWVGREEDTHGYWKDLGVTPVHSTLAADIFSYTNGVSLEHYRCDIGMVSGYWGYKSKTLAKYLLPLMGPDSPFNVKIAGSSHWPVPQYIGGIGENDERHFLKSCSICLNVHEPHGTGDSEDVKNGTTIGVELNERNFKCLSNKCFMVSDRPSDLANHIFNNNEIAFAKDPTEFRTLIEHFLTNPDEREGYIQRGYSKVINAHTYHHRAAYLLERLGLLKESKDLTTKYEQIKLDMSL